MKRRLPIALIALVLCTAAGLKAFESLHHTTIHRVIHDANGREVTLSIMYSQPVLTNTGYAITGSFRATSALAQSRDSDAEADDVAQYTATATVKCTAMQDPDNAVGALIVTATSGITGDLSANTFSMVGQGFPRGSNRTCELSTSAA